MSGYAVGDRIRTKSGRRGEVVRLPGPDLVTVRWDSDDEFDYTFWSWEGWFEHEHARSRERKGER